MKSSTTNKEKDLYDENISPSNSPKSIKKGTIAWKDLSKEKKDTLSAYYNAASKAFEFKEIISAECKGNLEVATSSVHYEQWQQSCRTRNAAASRLKESFSQAEFNDVLSKQSAYYVDVQSSKHKEILAVQEKLLSHTLKTQDLNEKLLSHIEPLLCNLFPDGPTSKTSKEYRFGSNGSLSVAHSGSKAGLFHDFEKDEGGGLLKFIARELCLNKNEAREWALAFVGHVPTVNLSARFKKPANRFVEPSNWVSLKADPKVPAPKFEDISKMHYYYKEVARYAYRNEKGDLLYYVLRLEDGRGNKKTPPLSYGRHKDSSELSWKLCGYKREERKNTLYNLHLLTQNPLSPVLVVEGEKTADKAIEKFPGIDFVCITWPGGASNVLQTDWSAVFGRDVVIWPDNDKAGFKAAREVRDELKKGNVCKVVMVENSVLFSKLPEKWDLADPLPEGVTLDEIESNFKYQIFFDKKN